MADKITHLQQLFQEEVVVQTSTYEELFPDEQVNAVRDSIKEHFQDKGLALFEVRRESRGLVHPATLLEVTDGSRVDYYSVRFFEKNEEGYRSEEYFDRARFHVDRMQKLTQLGRFYPPIRILDWDHAVFVLQEFLFAPICSFEDRTSVEELFELVLVASQAGFFLDFNQNHWLYDPLKGRLWYVDKDFCEEYSGEDRFELALKQNFNQVTIFFNKTNPPFFVELLSEYNNSADQAKVNFANEVGKSVRAKVKALEEREMTELIRDRLNVYREILSVLG